MQTLNSNLARPFPLSPEFPAASPLSPPASVVCSSPPEVSSPTPPFSSSRLQEPVSATPSLAPIRNETWIYCFSEWFCKNLSTLIIRSTLCSSNLFFSAWASLNIRSISSIFTMLAVLVLHRHTKDFFKTDHWWISMSSAWALNMGLHSKLYNYFCFPKKSEFKALHLIWQSALEHLKVRLLGNALECNKNSTDRICVYLDYISGDSCLFNFLNIYTYKRN